MIKFKNERQKKDFERISKNIYFNIENISINFMNDIIIDLKHLNDKELTEAIILINNINNKNIIYNKNHKKISIK